MSDEHTVSECIRMMLENISGEQKIVEIQVAAAWRAIAGENIMQFTSSLRFSDGHLFVYITSPALRNELFYSKSLLIRSINHKLKKNIVTDIRFL